MRDSDFERLFSAHAPGLFSFLAYRTGNRALAEDLLADTFERVLRARRGFDRRRGSERTWLYAIALNVLRDHLRRAGTEARALDQAAVSTESHEPDPHERLASQDAVRAGLARLSPEEQEAVSLRFGADLSLKEIAQATGEPVTTVEGRLYRALRKLKENLSPPNAD